MKPQIATQNETQIRQLIAGSNSAIATRDLDRLMAYYDQDVVTYDAKPPFQMGKDALRHTWEVCLPYFPEEFTIETRDLTVTADDNLAFAHSSESTRRRGIIPQRRPGCGRAPATASSTESGESSTTIARFRSIQ